MKIKIAVEMEFELPNVQVKKFEKCIGEFCEDIARTVADETASNMAAVDIGVKYVDHTWMCDCLCENDQVYNHGIINGILDETIGDN